VAKVRLRAADLHLTPFRSSYVDSLQLVTSINRTTDKGIFGARSLHGVACEFMAIDCQLSPNNPNHSVMWIAQTILRAAREPPLSESLEDIQGELKPESAERFSRIIKNLVKEARLEKLQELEEVRSESLRELEKARLKAERLEKELTSLRQLMAARQLIATDEEIEDAKEIENASTPLAPSAPAPSAPAPTPPAPTPPDTIASTTSALGVSDDAVLTFADIVEPISTSPPVNGPAKRQRGHIDAPKKKQRGPDDIDGRKEVALLKGLEKLGKIEDIYDANPKTTDSNKTDGARNFLLQIRPVVQCLRHHFHGNKDAFLQAWQGKGGDLATSKFRIEKCKGGETCGKS
jgi:hypothetical protein